MPQTIHASIDQERVMNAIAEDDNMGLCNACGADCYGCEPDMRGGECESCGAKAVYGAEEYLLMLVP